MSYTPSVNQTINEEASHQLAYGGEAPFEDAEVDVHEICRVVIFEGEKAMLATKEGVILGHATGNIFLRFASNNANHLNMSAIDENDSLSMPIIKHDENGVASMVETKEESDIVHRISIKDIKNETGMDLQINLLSVRAAGSTAFVNGISTVSDIIVAGTKTAESKTLYSHNMEDEVAKFAGSYFDSTATSIADDVEFKGKFAAVSVDSPIVHFYDTHEIDGEPRNTHSSQLRQEERFGKMHVIMSREDGKMYLKKTQEILNRFLAHADVCSKRFSVQVLRLQKDTLPAPATGDIGRLSFDVDIEYVKTSQR